ncbi:MAG: alpha/beta hydrolase [Candidatus Andersenbacteria bacterium]|nr:alpha/beta hydrolase [bacterium]MDZ4225565.1 alpha/beta hydrolase [Candidatus Andersenbacteria bacterium]
MKRQVLIIHGGTSFNTYGDYIDSLKTRELTKERLTQGADWKDALADNLDAGFEVLLPKMPNATNARYAEWSLWFERCVAFVGGGVILIGHSLGGIFLAKYLSENDFPKKIKATLLVAAPFSDTVEGESLADFALPSSLTKLTEQGGKICLFHSQDDPVVSFAHARQYQEALPQARLIEFKDKGHFKQSEFPELAELVLSL